jgi:hypothetical protein
MRLNGMIDGKSECSLPKGESVNVGRLATLGERSDARNEECIRNDNIAA